MFAVFWKSIVFYPDFYFGNNLDGMFLCATIAFCWGDLPSCFPFSKENIIFKWLDYIQFSGLVHTSCVTVLL